MTFIDCYSDERCNNDNKMDDKIIVAANLRKVQIDLFCVIFSQKSKRISYFDGLLNDVKSVISFLVLIVAGINILFLAK